MPERRPAAGGSHQQASAHGYFGALAQAKYMLLTTFKRDGIPVSACVHGVVDGDRAYFRAWYQSDTARRLRHTDDVQVAGCTAMGLVSFGPTLNAVARRLSAEEASQVARKVARNYPFRQRFVIPLIRRMRRWQMAHYELVTYEAAAIGRDELQRISARSRP